MRKIELTVIVPVRNEEKFIKKFLKSIIFQNYPKDKVEILIVDGLSEDRTREIIKKNIKKYPFVKLLTNFKKITPSGLNLAIKKAKGKYILRADAHAIYPKNYFSKSLYWIKKEKVENVGGRIIPLPFEKTLSSKAIALSLRSFFGRATSPFRKKLKKPTLVDTVFGGCWPKEIFEKIGYFDERLERSQDIEFNRRIKRFGGKILLVPQIYSFYFPKSKFLDYFKHNFLDGLWTIYPLKFKIKIFSFRHLLPLFLILTLPLSIWFYLPLCLFFSLKIALKEKEMKLFFPLILAFLCRHFGYGLGSLGAFFKIFF